METMRPNGVRSLYKVIWLLCGEQAGRLQRPTLSPLVSAMEESPELQPFTLRIS